VSRAFAATIVTIVFVAASPLPLKMALRIRHPVADRAGVYIAKPSHGGATSIPGYPPGGL
jgi:hypothetical protein